MPFFVYDSAEPLVISILCSCLRVTGLDRVLPHGCLQLLPAVASPGWPGCSCLHSGLSDLCLAALCRVRLIREQQLERGRRESVRTMRCEYPDMPTQLGSFVHSLFTRFIVFFLTHDLIFLFVSILKTFILRTAK